MLLLEIMKKDPKLWKLNGITVKSCVYHSLMTTSTTVQEILFPSDRNDQSKNESDIMSDWKEL